MGKDWRTHTHEPDDPWAYQHGPNLHTHDASGRVDTVLGMSVAGLDELEKARLERAAAGQGPNEFDPTDTPDVCYNCGEERDAQIDSEYCDECRERGRF